MTFENLGLSPETCKAVSDAGYSAPTPIQEKAIPYVLMGRDVLGVAQTGTGKTASFVLPMIDILASGRGRARMPRSLILEPTRELAAQVAENFDKYGKYNNLEMALLIGGESMKDQQAALQKGVDVLIATPGRLLDLFDRGQILLADTKLLVIDEADRMLDMGFIPDVERIVGLLPKIRQTLFFSATMASEIRRLSDQFLMNPKEISVAPPASPAKTVQQRVVRSASDAKTKRATLRALLDREGEEIKGALVFCNRKRDVDIVKRSLARHGYDAECLHGDMPQPARMETLNRFRRSEIRILVCSDVAARGLDIPAVSHVFNYDVPSNPEDYVHRIGRTGRAGRSGKAYMLLTRDDDKQMANVRKLIGINIEEEKLSGAPNAGASDAVAPAPEPETETDKPKARRSRSRRSAEDKPATAKPEAKSAKPEAPRAEDAASAKAPAKRAAAPKQAPRRPAKPEPRQADTPFGDHVPAFILREVTLSAGA